MIPAIRFAGLRSGVRDCVCIVAVVVGGAGKSGMLLAEDEGMFRRMVCCILRHQNYSFLLAMLKFQRAMCESSGVFMVVLIQARSMTIAAGASR